jgi:single stranded DNA-binding protein
VRFSGFLHRIPVVVALYPLQPAGVLNSDMEDYPPVAFLQGVSFGHAFGASKWICQLPVITTYRPLKLTVRRPSRSDFRAQLRSLRAIPEEDFGAEVVSVTTNRDPESAEDDFDIESAEFRPDIPLINIVILTGRLGQDPVLRHVGQDDKRKLSLLTFSLAVRDEVSDDEYVASAEPTTSWFKCELWGQRAESGARLLRKGLRIGVTGQLGFESYTNRAGEEVDAAVIMVRSFEVLQSKSEYQAGEAMSSPAGWNAGRSGPKTYAGQGYERSDSSGPKGGRPGEGPENSDWISSDPESANDKPRYPKAAGRDTVPDDGLPF